MRQRRYPITGGRFTLYKVAPRCARPPGLRGRLDAPLAARGLSGVAAYSLQKFIVTDDKSPPDLTDHRLSGSAARERTRRRR